MTTKVTGSVLANTAVTSGTYGGSSTIPVVTFDQQGRAIYAGNVTASIANTQITGLITSSQIASVANTQITGVIAGSQGGNPTGTILMWPTASAPTGYLTADGSAISRTTYAALFAVIGTVFGIGDGSTTFNLPNYTNRMPIGAGVTGPLSVSVGSTGGSANAITVSHTHTATSTVTDPGHRHSQTLQDDPGSRTNTARQAMGAFWATGYTDYANTGISVSTTIAANGSSGLNANLPPYLGIYFIIKT